MCAVLNGVFVLAHLCSYMSTFYLSTAEAVLQKRDDMEKMELLFPGFSDTVTLLICD